MKNSIWIFILGVLWTLMPADSHAQGAHCYVPTPISSSSGVPVTPPGCGGLDSAIPPSASRFVARQGAKRLIGIIGLTWDIYDFSRWIFDTLGLVNYKIMPCSELSTTTVLGHYYGHPRDLFAIGNLCIML